MTRRALGRRGLAEGALLVDWAAIVGDTLSDRCIPLKLSFAERARRCDGTLTLQVEPAWALELQHLAPQLIERINASLGYRAVARLALRQAPAFGWKAPKPKAAPVAAEPQAAMFDDDRLGLIGDDGLRDALAGLGRSLQTRRDA